MRTKRMVMLCGMLVLFLLALNTVITKPRHPKAVIKQTSDLSQNVEQYVTIEGYLGDEVTGRDHLPGAAPAIVLEDGTAIGLGNGFTFEGDPALNNLEAMYQQPNTLFKISGTLHYVDVEDIPEFQNRTFFVHGPLRSYRIGRPYTLKTKASLAYGKLKRNIQSWVE